MSKRDRWLDENEQHLCMLWEEETNLYDPRVRGYRNPEWRGKSMERIAQALDTTERVIIKRMMTLRTAFTKLYQKMGTGHAGRFTPRQRTILKRCHFLGPHVKAKPGGGSTVMPPAQIDLSDEEGEHVRGPSKADSDGSKAESESEQCDYDDDYSPPPISPRSDILPSSSTKQLKNDRGAIKSDGEDDVEIEEDQDDNDRPAKAKTENKDRYNPPRKARKIPTDLEPKVEGVDHETWASILAAKVRLMDSDIAVRFKEHVDSLAMDAIDGDWEPNTKAKS